MSAQSSSRGNAGLYNLISVVMLILTALTVCGVAGMAAFGPKTPQTSAAAPQPTLIVLGSSTPTLEFPTPNASWTPSPTPTITVTPTASKTPIPSQTTTPTNTPTATNTMTPTATRTPTPTLPATPTNTRSPFDFVLKNGVITYFKYTVHANDCGTRVAGAFFAINGSYMLGVNVHITGSGADNVLAAGSHPEYGSSGWEYYITNVPVARTYNVQAVYPDGTLASDVITVTTKADCNQNVAWVGFQQVQAR